ncbi:MAG: site-2 protease family protein [Myxococcaceae bacterium]|nr:site-2 protease family protein [Myxococcaceae bacterium]
MKRAAVHLFLFVGTCVTTWSCYRFYYGGTPAEAAVFAATIVGILGSHEMGHYVMARYHGVPSSLPYFIPVPIGFGTFGAVIRIRGRIPTRDALVDIGAAGPLAGLAVAIPLLVYGVATATVVDISAPALTFPGEMSLFNVVQGAIRWAMTQEAPNLTRYEFGQNLISYGLERLLVGRHDILATPIILGTWFGMVMTMLNLMPIGQLDGGHLTHAWFGPHAVPLGKAVAFAMACLVLFFSATWLIWLVITTRVVGFRHPEVAAPHVPLSFSRKVVCATCFVFFVLTLMPVPIAAF